MICFQYDLRLHAVANDTTKATYAATCSTPWLSPVKPVIIGVEKPNSAIVRYDDACSPAVFMKEAIASKNGCSIQRKGSRNPAMPSTNASMALFHFFL